MNLRTGIILLLFGFTLFSCKKDNSGTSIPVTKGLYITNEGNFTFGNGEVSFYDPATGQITNDLFKTANGYGLGDVVQSIFIKDSVAFIVVNNSSKIEMVSIPSFKKIRTITLASSSPRYFLPISDSLAFVTDLYAGSIYVFNYNTGLLHGTIAGLSTWTEHMLPLNGSVVVEERSLDSDPTHHARLALVSASGNVQHFNFDGSNCNGIVKDKTGHIWLAAEQDSVNGHTSALYCLNSDLSINKKISLAMSHHPTNLAINGTGDQLYFFDNDLYRLPIDSNTAPANSFISRNSRNFYSFTVDPANEDVYVSDALDYVQRSRIYRYDKNGQLNASFSAGIISGNFAFSYE